MRQVIRLLSAGLALGLIALGCELPTEVQVKGSPDYQLPAGRLSINLNELLGIDDAFGVDIEESFVVDIDQSDVFDDFSLDGFTVGLVEPDGSATVNLPPSGQEGLFTISALGTYSEIEFENGTLNLPLEFDTLSAGAEAIISNVRLVTSGGAVIANADEDSITVTGNDTAAFSIDLAGAVLPNSFRLELRLEFTDGDAGHGYDLSVSPGITGAEIARISGVDFPAIDGDATYEGIELDTPDFIESATIVEGEMVLLVNTPDNWSGIEIFLEATISDGGSFSETASDTGPSPELRLPLDGLPFDGSSLEIDWNWEITGTNATIAFEAGVASLGMDVELAITDLTLEIGPDDYVFEDDDGNPFFRAEDDAFGRDEVDDDFMQDIFDSIRYASMNFAVVNQTGLNPLLELSDDGGSSFATTVDFSVTAPQQVELTEADFDHFRENFFLPVVNLIIPQGTLSLDTTGELSVGIWLEVRSEIDLKFPLGGEE
ncbi:hypothetical protein [Spirochaeta africana]|uniref:Uncharacterized protein n=1 Tax=Spirochaeta africana (strain ATCC 700263 / DSM 8902 / Z-7692) TaxID=889378 RepID=H9UFH0_SPIAZ|nr:hypothetical protein [Spirochaeta africana]AFG36263.1 hypothetical protein Spiaf_0154 [Spirochaeta africana DSM 8902]